MENIKNDLIKNWNALPNQWKATLRTLYQAIVAAILLFLLSLLNGASLDGAWDSLRDDWRLALIALITFIMNRNGKGAAYRDFGAVDVESHD